MKRGWVRVVSIVAILVMVASVVAVALAGRDTGDRHSPDPADTAEPTAAADPCDGVDAPAAPEPAATPYDAPPPMEIETDQRHVATLQTTCGDITLELFAADAPTTVNNFVALSRDGYYDGVGFHRVVPGFVIQGGDPTGTGHGGQGQFPGYTFDDELDLAEQIVEEHGGYPRGTLAMANAGENTNGSQFFVVHGTVIELPPSFTVFGRVLDGMQVVDRIVAGETGDQLTEPERIVSVEIDARPGEQPADAATETPS